MKHVTCDLKSHALSIVCQYNRVELCLVVYLYECRFLCTIEHEAQALNDKL